MNLKQSIIRVLLFLPILIFSFTLSCSQESKASAGTYLELNLNDAIIANYFTLRHSPLEVFRIIEKAANDDNINGIILNISSINRSREYLWELRRALEQFKTSGDNGKKIVAYINNADIDVYMLASVADKIVMDEMGFLTMLGYSAGRGYVSQTLEKFGIGVQELRYFEYKSAAESYTRTNMSAADRRQYSDYLDDVFNHTRSALMESRGWTLEEFNNIINKNFMYSAPNAIAHNLVDYKGGLSAVQSAIFEIEEKIISNYSLYGDADTSLTDSSPYIVTRKQRAPAIAIVYADGETDMTRGMEIAKLVNIINEIGKNKQVKAIVVRINSPGGSAQAAEALAKAISNVRFESIFATASKKPVVISMGQVAASGGYWASVTADHIMATPYTVTGSIGVIGSWFYDNGLYNKMGVSTDVLKRGDHSDLMTGVLIPYRKLTAQEEEQYKKYILDLYNIFIEKVALGRKMNLDEVEAVAQGRIFSGTRALDAGLIDSIGSLYDAVNKARELANIPEKTIVSYREYPEPKLSDILLGRMFAKSTPALLDIFVPADINYRLENNGQVMPIMPMDFNIW